MYEELTPSKSNCIPWQTKKTSAVENSTPPLEVLRTELENELRADKKDIRSYPWYHGKVPRDVAEDLLSNEGDFLVRESITNVADYVLTCKDKGAYYHFKINKIIMQSSPTHTTVRYCLEERYFESLPDLVHCYVDEKLPVSKKTGVILGEPVNRAMPISYSDVKYASLRRQHQGKSPSGSTKKWNNNMNTQQGPRKCSPPNSMMTPPSFIPWEEFHKRTGSDPLLSPGKSKSESNPSSPHPRNVNNNNSIDSAFPFTNQNSSVPTLVSKCKNVPPKPSRVPSFRTSVIKSSTASQESTRMSSLKNSAAFLGDGIMNHPTIAEISEQIAPSDSRVCMRLKPTRSRKAQELAARRGKRASCFKPAQYQCTMLSHENPPLEQKALKEVKTLLLETDPFKLARHMTVIDCKVCRIMEEELGRIMLPHSSQLRKDITERYQCIAFWVAICIIKSTVGREERAEMMNQFIQLANELVHSMGNVFGFSGIMHGLTCPQVLSLDSAWDSLRLKFTNNAVTFEKKLRPLLRLLDEGKGRIRSGATCIPHIMPLVRLLEHTGHGIPHSSIHDSAAKKSVSFGSLLDRFSPATSPPKEETSLTLSGRDTSKVDWWENVPDESFDSLLSHLHSGRSLLMNLNEFKTNANTKLLDFKEISNVREMFTTDFQMRLLFGYKSAESPRHDRFHKFDRIISAMLRLIVD